MSSLTTREIILFQCHRPALPPSSPSHRRRVPSVSGEQAPKPTSPRVPARGRGRIRFLGSAVATARWTSSSLYARLHGSASTVFFPLRQSRCKNVDPLSSSSVLVFSIASSRLLVVVSYRTASGRSYVSYTCCWSFSYYRN